MRGGLFHPRCKHGKSIYFESINEEPNEIKENEHNKNTEYIQELEKRKEQYERLATGSLYTSNIKDYSDKIQNLQIQIESAKIDEEEKHAINQYVSSKSYIINEKLRNSENLNKEDIELLSKLDSALNKLPNYEGVAVRTLYITDRTQLEAFLEKNKINSTKIESQYLSFSKKSGYNEQANVFIFINAKSAKDLSAFNPDEAEILYIRNSKFKTLNIEKQDNKYYILWEEINEK